MNRPAWAQVATDRDREPIADFLMHLIRILLPLYDNNNRPFLRSDFEAVRSELMERFGGVTAFVRSPAEGLWKENEGKVNREDIVMLEVFTKSIEHEWWSQYRKALEQRFKQNELVVLAIKVEQL